MMHVLESPAGARSIQSLTEPVTQLGELDEIAVRLEFEPMDAALQLGAL